MVDGELVFKLPDAFVRRHQLAEGAVVEVDLDDTGRLAVSVLGAKHDRPRYTLNELLEQIPPGEELPIDREWEQAPPVGREQL